MADYLVEMDGPGTETVWADTWRDAYVQFAYWLERVDHVAVMRDPEGRRVPLSRVIEATVEELGEDGYLELLVTISGDDEPATLGAISAVDIVEPTFRVELRHVTEDGERTRTHMDYGVAEEKLPDYVRWVSTLGPNEELVIRRDGHRTVCAC